MNDLIVKNVDMFGDTIMAAKDRDGNIWAGVSYFCKALGMDKAQKDNQVERVQKDDILRRGAGKFPAGVFDSNNEAVALRIDFVPIWLTKISITPKMRKERPELAEKLLQYQLKAKDVLAAAFLVSEPAITYQYPLPAATFESVANLGRLIERVMKTEGACPHEIAMVLKPIFQQAGIEIGERFIKIPAYEQLSLDIVTR